MSIPFKHPLATHAAGTVLGRRRNGSPIYAIAGGSPEGDPAPAPVAPPAPAPVPAPPAPADPPKPADPDPTDWKAHSREWEKKAKANSAELEKFRQAAMTDQEKAVEAARTEGRTAAESEARSTAVQLAVYRAAATAGADPDALLDSRTFLTSLAEIDPKDTAAITKAIEAAVKTNPKLSATPAAGASGAPMPGGPGGTRERPTSLGAAVSGHYGR
jgi:hypothetical protein